MLLSGYAIENLLKGINAASGIKLAKDGKIIKPFDTNSFNKLIDNLPGNTLITDEESALLQRLEGFVKVAGRYPTPLN
jgi:hypothetical protein